MVYVCVENVNEYSYARIAAKSMRSARLAGLQRAPASADLKKGLRCVATPVLRSQKPILASVYSPGLPGRCLAAKEDL